MPASTCRTMASISWELISIKGHPFFNLRKPPQDPAHHLGHGVGFGVGGAWGGLGSGLRGWLLLPGQGGQGLGGFVRNLSLLL